MNTISLTGGSALRGMALAFLLSIAFGASASVAQSPSSIGKQFSALWYDPERNGEGLNIEIISDSLATMTWFTYGVEGGQQWFFGVGSIERAPEGERIVFPDLWRTSGGRFGADFDPNDVAREMVGSAVLRFPSCDSAILDYDVIGHVSALTLTRLTTTMATSCGSPHGRPGEVVQPHAGQSGSWYDPSHDGEGFQIQWSIQNEALLTWYTYDAEGRQYWLTGVGHLQGESIVFASVYATTGARFGAEFSADDVELIDWGRLEIALTCAGGIASYESRFPEFGSGQQDLVRLTFSAGQACPWQPPKFTDLYEVTYIPLPTHSAAGVPIVPYAVGSSGVVFGTTLQSGMQALARTRIGESSWTLLTDAVLHREAAWLSEDEQSVVVNGAWNSSATNPVAFDPAIYRDGTGLAVLEGRLFVDSVVNAVSANGQFVAGRGSNPGEFVQYTYVWPIDGEQVVVPEAGRPTGVSDDGNVLVGAHMQPSGNVMQLRAFRYQRDSGHLETLRDPMDGAVLSLPTACNRDCSVVFGRDVLDIPASDPRSGLAWFWTAAGSMQFLGTTPDALEVVPPKFGVFDTSADGTIAVGAYATLMSDRSLGSHAFVWTQHTGVVPIRTLFDDLDPAVSWDIMDAVSISPDGTLVVLHGYDRQPLAAPAIRRSAVLRLKGASTAQTK
jgi:hypothetical protein